MAQSVFGGGEWEFNRERWGKRKKKGNEKSKILNTVDFMIAKVFVSNLQGFLTMSTYISIS
jgi:hypothetical protein